MMSSCRSFLATCLPLTASVNRFAWCLIESRRLLPSYSQHGEDAWLLRQLSGTDPAGTMYVDVGGSHPMRLSNTYLLYRHGFDGVVIEPHHELVHLHRRFRRRDVAIWAGCGSVPALQPFYVSSTSVLSSFQESWLDERREGRHLRVDYVPVLPLDVLLTPFAERSISLLSIDAEGMDVEILAGGIQALARTSFLCIEANDEIAERRISNVVGGQFELARRFGCNLVWKRKER